MTSYGPSGRTAGMSHWRSWVASYHAFALLEGIAQQDAEQPHDDAEMEQ